MPDDTDIPTELADKICAYVELEWGHDFGLSLEDVEMVRELLLKDPAARALANDFRDVNIGLEGMFKAFASIPASDELMQRIHAQTREFETRTEVGHADHRDRDT